VVVGPCVVVVGCKVVVVVGACVVVGETVVVVVGESVVVVVGAIVVVGDNVVVVKDKFSITELPHSGVREVKRIQVVLESTVQNANEPTDGKKALVQSGD
jgi:hypothetical protein